MVCYLQMCGIKLDSLLHFRWDVGFRGFRCGFLYLLAYLTFSLARHYGNSKNLLYSYSSIIGGFYLRNITDPRRTLPYIMVLSVKSLAKAFDVTPLILSAVAY